ncbi:hypothetical protein FISHEDRAFT_60053 [Fistulina hepatica ATCC 64428]|uniref:Uncharacterized protein n=1 Tax=Fistulina hepatica ATCC 64428 TaxID=1128425 RepID=A0A0D7A745_9AGAR|nr:hypothetical protein FISHEDRAFT_60053 [Fistulina hepatica ATCC 64428]
MNPSSLERTAGSTPNYGEAAPPSIQDETSSSRQNPDKPESTSTSSWITSSSASCDSSGSDKAFGGMLDCDQLSVIEHNVRLTPAHSSTNTCLPLPSHFRFEVGQQFRKVKLCIKPFFFGLSVYAFSPGAHVDMYSADWESLKSVLAFTLRDPNYEFKAGQLVQCFEVEKGKLLDLHEVEELIL